MNKNTWTQEEQIRYELALDLISGLKGILSRIIYWNKQNPIIDEVTIEKIHTRQIELEKEWQNRSLFSGHDTITVENIINTYGPLNKKFNTDYDNLANTKGDDNIKCNDCFFNELIEKRINYAI